MAGGPWVELGSRLAWPGRRRRALAGLGPVVCLFGSEGCPEGHADYELTRELGRRLGRSGFTVMTGGGAGLMEAAHRGAADVLGPSVAADIQPIRAGPNPWVGRTIRFADRFARKVMLARISYAFLVMPGGFGPLAELFETGSLLRTGQIMDFPVVAMGTGSWGPSFLCERMRRDGWDDPEHGPRLVVSDDPDRAMATILESAHQRFGRRPGGVHGPVGSHGTE